MPEEIALGYYLLKTFADDRDRTGKFTEVDEDVVMDLAICQVGIDVEKYPYKDVKVGKRFEYLVESAGGATLCCGEVAWQVQNATERTE